MPLPQHAGVTELSRRALRGVSLTTLSPRSRGSTRYVGELAIRPGLRASPCQSSGPGRAPSTLGRWLTHQGASVKGLCVSE